MHVQNGTSAEGHTLKMGTVVLMDLKATVVMRGSPHTASSGTSRIAAANAEAALVASSVASTKPCMPTCRMDAQAVATSPPLLHTHPRFTPPLPARPSLDHSP